MKTHEEGHRWTPDCEECLDGYAHTKCLCCPTTLYLPVGATVGTNGAICSKCRKANNPQAEAIYAALEGKP